MAQKRQTKREQAAGQLIEAIYISASSLSVLWQNDPLEISKQLLAQRKTELDELQRAMYELGTEQAIEERFGAQWTNS